jgi:hypothetical protein
MKNLASTRSVLATVGLFLALSIGCAPESTGTKGNRAAANPTGTGKPDGAKSGEGAKPDGTAKPVVVGTISHDKAPVAPAGGNELAAVDEPGKETPAAASDATMAEAAAKHAALQEYRRLDPPDAKMFPGLKQMSEDCDVWFDAEKKRVVMRGGVCLREGQLEMLACIHRWLDEKDVPGGKVRAGTKEHESVLTINTTAAVVHSALLLTGVTPGSPVKFQPEYQPATGPVIEVTLHWTDADGKPREAKGQDWVQDVKTKQAMTLPWVFAGSVFHVDEQTGKRIYRGEHGNLICVSNFSDAVLDVPVPSTADGPSLMFTALTERIPPLGTPVTIVLTPKPEK